MAKKSTDFEWEPKNKGDKLVSFLLWIILVILIVYGALIYKNREELFNLKTTTIKNSGNDIKIQVKRDLNNQIPDKKEKKIKQDITKKVEEKTTVKVVKKTEPVVKHKKTDLKVTDEKIKVVGEKTKDKIYVFKVFPFKTEKSAKKFYKTLKIQTKNKKVIMYKDIYALVVSDFKDEKFLKTIQTKITKDGLTGKIYEKVEDALNTSDLKKEYDSKISKIKLKEDLLKNLYTVQVVSVRNAANAEKLKTKITNQTGIKDIFIIPAKRDEKPIYKVRVGAFKTREEAKKNAVMLKNKFSEIPGYWIKKGIYD